MLQKKQEEKKNSNRNKDRNRNKNKNKRSTNIGIDNLFRQTSRLNMQINAKLEEISYWRTLASKAEVIFSVTNTGGNSRKNRSRVEDCVCKIADIEESLQTDMSNLIGLKETAMRIIDKVDVPEYRSLLMHRYICGKKWEQVADSMGYSYVHTVHRLHPKALMKLSEVGIGTGIEE